MRSTSPLSAARTSAGRREGRGSIRANVASMSVNGGTLGRRPSTSHDGAKRGQHWTPKVFLSSLDHAGPPLPMRFRASLLLVALFVFIYGAVSACVAHKDVLGAPDSPTFTEACQLKVRVSRERAKR